MPEWIRVYQGNQVETVPLSPSTGLSFGDSAGTDYRFPEGSCGGSSVRFFVQNGVWQVVCRGNVMRDGLPAVSSPVHGGELFVLNAASHFAVQFIAENTVESTSFPLDQLPELLIGRAPGCTIRLDEKRVSGSHAKLYRKGNEWRVCDNSSTNGTF